MHKLYKLEKQLTEIEDEITIQKGILSDLEGVKKKVISEISLLIPKGKQQVGVHTFNNRLSRAINVHDPLVVVKFFDEKESLDFIDVKIPMAVYDTLNNMDVTIPGIELITSSKLAVTRKRKT